MTLIIDGSNILNRCYWAITRSVQTYHIDIASVFLKTLHSYVRDFHSNNVIICWDLRQGENERRIEFNNYKAQRLNKPEVYARCPAIIELTGYLGIKNLFPLHREADDIIYWLAMTKVDEAIIITGDSDLQQLVGEKAGIKVWEPGRKQFIDNQFLQEKYGIYTGKELLIYKAIKGDKADNIPGIVKRIKKEKLILLIDEIKNDRLNESNLVEEEDKEIIRRNLKLMDLSRVLTHTDEIDYYNEEYKKEVSPDFDFFFRRATELGYNSIIKNFESWISPFRPVQSLEDILWKSTYEKTNTV